MLKDDSYFKQVNRRLAGARFLLSSIDAPELNANPVGRQALMDSALLQFYFAAFSYLNELLEYYHKPVLDITALDLSAVLSESDQFFAGVHEFVALQKWSQENHNIFEKLAVFPIEATRLAGDKPDPDQPIQQNSKRDNVVEQVDLIAVSDAVEEIDLNNVADVQAIKMILAGFQSLVDSQRENQLEY